MLRTSVTAFALVALLGLGACGDDADEADNSADNRPTATAPAADPDPERYCALTRRLDAEGEKFFTGLDEDATPQQFEAAEAKFVKQMQPKLDELRRVAPREIASDVDKLLAGMQQRARMKPAIDVTEAESSAAEARVQRYEERNCS
jgi:hypothetical protein